MFGLIEHNYRDAHKRGGAMSAFGVKVQELLRQRGHDASWLAAQTGIDNSTISNWLNNPNNVTPKPSSVAKVAKAFGITVDDLAVAAGYTIRQSSSDDARLQRINTLMAQNPRIERIHERLSRLPAVEADRVLSMLEAYLSSIPDET